VTPEEEDQVRRALAAAPPVEGLPAEVAARLDATLADLVAERPAGEGGPEPGAVTSLEERRRRRWPGVLVAAAAVSVLAYGVGTTLGGVGLSGGSAESTAARDETFSGAGADSADDGATGGGAEDAPEEPDALVTDREDAAPGASPADGRALLVSGTVRLHRGSLREEVGRLVQDAVHARALADAQKSRDTAGFLGERCERPDLARGDRLAAVRLDGRRATLVVRKAVEGTRVAEIYSCGNGSDLLAITQVPSSR